MIGQDYSREAWFKKAKETEGAVISGLIIDEMGEGHIRVVRPVYIENEKGNKKFNGAIICSFDPKILANIF
ncbi:MAG: cache domain-containing protein, partial [Syntrophobacterales bacterium]|nr:cache domain-containing protein [Syntrophobacterales bacterium]